MDIDKLTIEIFSKLEHKWLTQWDSAAAVDKSASKTRILSIDGSGGIKALASGDALVHLEDTLRSLNPDASITDYFDLVAGTGIGGLLAAMLVASDPSSGRPLFTARSAVEFLRSRRRRLFRPSSLLRRRSRRFSSSSLDSVLREALKTLTLRDTCRPLLIPCYDLNTSAPFVFSRADATGSPSFDFELWRVCRATAATPGMFKPCQVVSVDGRTACVAVDGGLVMNNPAAAAVTHVLHNKKDFPSVSGVEDLLVLSLGTGPPPPRPGGGGGRCSVGDVVEIMLDGVSETVDQALANAFCWNPMDYVRIQGNGCAMEADRADGERMLKERGVETLPFGGKRLLMETNGERIERLSQRLVASGRPAGDLTPAARLADGS